MDQVDIIAKLDKHRPKLVIDMDVYAVVDHLIASRVLNVIHAKDIMVSFYEIFAPFHLTKFEMR